MGSSRTAEVTVGSFGAVFFVVQAKKEVQLLLGVTTGVSTVVTSSRVTADTGTVDIGAKVVEHIAVVLAAHIVLNNATQSILGTFTNGVVWGWRQGGSSLPDATHSGAGSNGCRGGGRVGVDGSQRWRNRLDGRLQVVEISQGGDGVAGYRHKTVVVLFLEVHVHDTTRPDISHFVGEDGADLLKLSRCDFVTTVLREEDRDTQVLVGLSGILVTGLLESGRATPLVHVDTEEVSSVLLTSTSKVVSKLDSNVLVVVGRVTHRNGSVVLLLDVSLGVTNSGLDVSRSIGVGGLVGDLVTGEETQDVGVVGELVDHRSVSGQQFGVPGGVGSVDRSVWLGQVGNNIDTGIVQHLHTVGVVLGGIQSVHSDDVGVQLLQVRNVSLTSVNVGQWVDVLGGGGGVGGVLLVGDTLHQELGAVIGVVEFVSDNLDGRQGGQGRGSKGHGGGD